MNSSESMVSELEWSTVSVTGVPQSMTLPKVVRTFEDYAKVDYAIGDNDPVYWAVCRARSEFGHGWATRFCVGMLTYYHMGTAARAADEEGIHFWQYLLDVYHNAPRASMRRHFRGAAGIDALHSMRRTAQNPDRFFDDIPRTFMGTRKYCNENLVQFGEVFQLKIVDYMDRCLGLPFTDMTGLGKYLPKQPSNAVKVLYPELGVEEGFRKACFRIYELHMLAPPLYDRPIGPAEVETALCDWKTAKFGGNWLGSDLIQKRADLKRINSPKAVQMADWLPPVVKEGTFKLELE